MKKLFVLVLCLVLLSSLAAAAVYNQVPIYKTTNYRNTWSWRDIFKIGGGITGAAVANFQPKQNAPAQYHFVQSTPQPGKYYNSITGNSVYDPYAPSTGRYYVVTYNSNTWRPVGHTCDYFGCK